MAGRALDVVRIQRVVNTCWLSESLGQLPAIARQMGERGTERHGERGSFVCVEKWGGTVGEGAGE